MFYFLFISHVRTVLMTIVTTNVITKHMGDIKKDKKYFLDQTANPMAETRVEINTSTFFPK